MTRIDLAKLFAELGFTEGAEIGVFVGEYADVLLHVIPKLHLRCVDSWAWSRAGERGHWNTYFGSKHHGRPYKIHQQNYDATLKRLTPYPGAEIMRMLSHEAAALVPDGALDFVYIDAEHTYDACLADLRAWSPKVRSGGIVSGDDYRYVDPRRSKRWRPAFRGVNQAVEEFSVEQQIAEWFYTSDATRKILGVLYNQVGRAFPSFFWQKP
jgi:hypothetical protein